MVLHFICLKQDTEKPQDLSISEFQSQTLLSIMARRSAVQALFFNTILIFFLIAVSTAQPNFTRDGCSNNAGNYTINSLYQTNLDATLFSIKTITYNNVITNGFYNESSGQGADRVNAIALCRGDVSLDNCRRCVRTATKKIIQVCPNQREAIGWYRNCMLRYSNKSIFGQMETQPTFYVHSEENVTNNLNESRRALQSLLTDLRIMAASGDLTCKFATGNTTVNSERIYALVQCTPDLTTKQCNDCLDDAIKRIPKCCDGKIGGRVLNPSCNFRFSRQRFFEVNPEFPQQSPSPQPQKGKRSEPSKTVIIITVVISTISFVLLVSCICYFRPSRERKTVEEISDVDEDKVSSREFLQFDFGIITVATDNFSEANRLGEGGFGAVYKGILSDGKEVAVKRLSGQSRQGEQEFKNEVLLVAKLQHRNLVRLLGFCLERNERLLIYEFVPNSSLDRFIFDSTSCESLDWEKRYKIIGGIARGLVYLHEDSQYRIIHGDLKASNILLDAEMNPKISDFGLARLFELDQTQSNTTKVVGTFGYMAPEYVIRGQFSAKSDVYSFGVLVLEIVSGQKNSCFCKGETESDLLTYAWETMKDGDGLKLIDPTLRAISTSEILRCIHIGLLCVQENVADRPTMASVTIMLSSYSVTLPVPSKPAFFGHTSQSTRGSDESNSRSVQASKIEVTISELDPR